MSISQRNEGLRRTARRRSRNALRVRNETHPQPIRPAGTQLLVLYGLRMRNTRDGLRGVWATYAKAARESAGLSQSELARRLGVDRVTVYRWEKGQQRPEDATVVQRFAQVVGVDLDEALGAAGLRPAQKQPQRREPRLDPDLVIIARALADPNVPADQKATIRRMLDALAEIAERTPPKRKREAS